MSSPNAKKVIRRMKFVFVFLLVLLSILFVVAWMSIANSGQPIEKWLDAIQMVISSMTLMVAVVVSLLTHGYSAKLLELSELQLGVANEQLNLVKRQLVIATQELEVARRRLDEPTKNS